MADLRGFAKLFALGVNEREAGKSAEKGKREPLTSHGHLGREQSQELGRCSPHSPALMWAMNLLWASSSISPWPVPRSPRTSGPALLSLTTTPKGQVCFHTFPERLLCGEAWTPALLESPGRWGVGHVAMKMSHFHIPNFIN